MDNVVRPCNVQWMRDIVKQCKAAKIKCFVKQLGSNPGFRPEDEEKNGNPGPSFDHYDHEYGLYIKKMDTFKGTDFNNFPEELKIREYPIVKG